VTPPPTEVATQETGSTASRTITVTSDPEGVEVWRADELLGNTPFQIPRPDGEARVELTLRKAEYNDQPVRVSNLTAESVRITLERARRGGGGGGGGRRPPGGGGMAEEPAMAEVVMTEPPPTMMSTVTQTEVLDPWAQ
jgi:hypothetical protein